MATMVLSAPSSGGSTALASRRVRPPRHSSGAFSANSRKTTREVTRRAPGGYFQSVRQAAAPSVTSDKFMPLSASSTITPIVPEGHRIWHLTNTGEQQRDATLLQGRALPPSMAEKQPNRRQIEAQTCLVNRAELQRRAAHPQNSSDGRSISAAATLSPEVGALLADRCSPHHSCTDDNAVPPRRV